MNGNTFDEDNIPELIGSLEGSVAAPDPAAIHAGLSKRQAFRRRAISGAGAFIAVLALAGGALALSNNTTTTETAADDAVVQDGLIFEFGNAVADDSAPVEDVPTTTVVFPIDVPKAVVLIDECANGSTISFGSEEWLAWELPAAWEGRATVPVNIVINGNELVATDETGLTAPFVRNDGQGWPLPCLGFTYEQPRDPTEPTATTVVDPAGPSPDAVLATSANIDGVPGDEHIWLDPDGTLHAGDLVGFADSWAISDYWLNEQAALYVVAFDDDTNAIVLSRPIAEQDEDPPNVVQVFFVREQGLQRVLDRAIGVYRAQPITVAGDGTASYVQDGWTACRHAEPGDVVVRQRIILTADGDDGELIQTASEDTDLQQDCSQLAG